MRRLTGLAAGALIAAGAALAQGGRGIGEWTTSGGDAQRSSWVRTDPKISRESVQRPDFRLLWKVKFANDPRELDALTSSSLLNSYIGYRGFRSLAFTGGSGNAVFAVDTDLGRLEWQKHFTLGVQPAAASWACPGGMTANVTRPTSIAFPGAGPGGRGGRGSPAHSGVGESGEGAATIAEIRAAAAARGGGRAPAPPPAGRGGRAPAGPYDPHVSLVHAIASDGMLHSLIVSNGDEPMPPVPFVPANANAGGLIEVDGVAYASTSQGCGGAANGVWALDLTSREVTSWKSGSGSVAGSTGIAVNSDGTIFVATEGGELLSLDAKTLKPKDGYKAGPGFTSSPVIFEYKGKTLVAVLAKDGSMHLLDTADLGKALFQTPANRAAADLPPGALASWQDSAGTRFLMAPGTSAILAWKVAEQNGAPILQTAWTSREMVAPLTPMIVNGVAFAISSGEFRTSDSRMTAAQRAQRSTPAVLYALDGATGKELWSSGKAITSFVHGGGLSGGASQMYLGTYDGTFYAFGMWIEH